MDNRKIIFIVLGVVGIIGLTIAMYVIIAGQNVKKQFSTAKANTYKSYAQALLSDAYTEKVFSSDSVVSCNKLGSYNSDYMASCDITFDSSNSPTITVVGDGIYKGYCIYGGTMYKLEVVKCK